MICEKMINNNACLTSRLVSAKRDLDHAKRQSIQFSYMNLIGAMLQMPVDQVPAVIKRSTNQDR